MSGGVLAASAHDVLIMLIPAFGTHPAQLILPLLARIALLNYLRC